MRIVDGRTRVTASDLANYLACRHLTRLDLLKAHGKLEPPQAFDIGFQALLDRGEAHERMVRARFRADGLGVQEIEEHLDTAGAAAATADAIGRGVDVIYQGTLLGDHQLGRPDFLVRAELLRAPDDEPRPSIAHYEVVDAKLARTAKARAVLQTAFYTRLLAVQQGIEPRWMHLALGNGEFASFKVKDFAAYERRTGRMLEEFVVEDPGTFPPTDTYPDPVEHCAICRWSSACQARRRKDDDLSLIAGITKRQRKDLKEAGYPTRRGFAALEEVPTLQRLGRGSLERAHLQARLQVESEEGEIRYELLDPERDETGKLVPNRGLLALPAPVEGDLFFDIEGARYYSEDGKEFGLQYLFGIVDTGDLDDYGHPRYAQIWSFDRMGEKRAFEELIDFITERRNRAPALHVYHYNHYEPTSVDHLTELHETRQEAVGRLMGRFGTHEDEVDDLFRLGVFVDLYQVVRQGLRAGVQSYSIKQLEPLCGYERAVDLPDATKHLIAFEAALDEGTARNDLATQLVVAGYNEDDCQATLALRGWLEKRRAELAARVEEQLPRPTVHEEAHATEDPEVARIKRELLDGVPDEAQRRSEDQAARALMADLLEWHRREAKPGWWRYFYVRTLSSEELIEEPDAIGGLEGGNQIDQVKKSVILRFAFPPQEHGFEEGQLAHDPMTAKAWTIWRIDDDAGTIDLKIGIKNAAVSPSALVEGGPYDMRSLAERVRELGARIADEGLTGHDAATALLLRRRPNGDGQVKGSLRRAGETATEAAVRLALGLDASYLPIQGPPGTGKTYTGAEAILALVAAGRKVGITGPSHAVIHNLIDELLDHAADYGRTVRVGQRADVDNPFLHPGAKGMSYAELEDAVAGNEVDIVAGTVWLWTRSEFKGIVHALVVDEAGQMSLANILAVAGAARNLILLGDPQQLAQPSQAAHPPGAGASPLEHVLSGHVTMPSDAGLFIEQTRRMHPDLCAYTSEVFYDGKLTGIEGLDRQVVLGDGWLAGSGLRIVEVSHEGNTNGSPEEAAQVVRIVTQLLGREWRNTVDAISALREKGLLIVTPYNVQRQEIDAALKAAGTLGIKVGTVDKFQGRQAPIVIYSTATSTAEDAPRGMEFLYDLHRMNVSTSRAQAMVILVVSPNLSRVFCRTPRQMILVNAFCGAVERGVNWSI